MVQQNHWSLQGSLLIDLTGFYIFDITTEARVAASSFEKTFEKEMHNSLSWSLEERRLNFNSLALQKSDLYHSFLWDNLPPGNSKSLTWDQEQLKKKKFFQRQEMKRNHSSQDLNRDTIARAAFFSEHFSCLSLSPETSSWSFESKNRGFRMSKTFVIWDSQQLIVTVFFNETEFLGSFDRRHILNTRQVP